MLIQIFNHPVGGCHIINRYAGQIGNLQAGGTVGQQHTGHTEGFQFGCEIIQVGTEKHNAVGLAFGTDALGLRYLVGFLVNIIDKGHVAAGGNFALQIAVFTAVKFKLVRNRFWAFRTLHLMHIVNILVLRKRVMNRDGVNVYRSEQGYFVI